MYVSIDLVEEIIERQLKKYKNKIITKQQSNSNFRKEYIEKKWKQMMKLKSSVPRNSI